MPKPSSKLLPAAQRVLRELGANIKMARLRRGFAAALVAERAGMSRTTLRSIEKGSSGVTLGAVANVLHSLGLVADLALVARDDELGRRLQDAGLETRNRAPRRRRSDRAGGPAPESS
ncbi:MAG: helix-turn-helix domain-containing protein [Planctomycetes bacterium]|nr:helix-turn-helix domain-containing protein [Planctomycetota bacterium]MCB9886077.1 helix-turn-helix domain-containing protein [Planctomycetota bacterium]